MASPSPASSDSIDWNEFAGSHRSSPITLGPSGRFIWGLDGASTQQPPSNNHRLPAISETPTTNTPDGRDPLRQDKEDRLLMTLWLLTDSGWCEKQRAIKLVHGFEYAKGRLSSRLTNMKHRQLPPLWQPHWPTQQQSFVTMHRPSQWTYLEIKLLRQLLAFPPPDPMQFDYNVATFMMNRAKYQDLPALPCWRPGGPYTAAEVELCAMFMFWRLPTLKVKPTAQWTVYEYGDLCSRFRLEIPLATLVKMVCEKQSQFKPYDGLDFSYDRLSVEKALDNLIVGPRFGPPVQLRYELGKEHQQYFGMLGPGAPGLGPDFLDGEDGEVSI